MHKVAIFLFLTLVTSTKCQDNFTTARHPFVFQCEEGMSIDKVRSVYYRSAHDRTWAFACRPFNLPTKENATCSWTGFQSNYHQPMNFQCPGDGIITGIKSKFSKGQRDRLFQFKCCTIGDYVAHSCQYTNYINKYKEKIDYSVLFDDWYLRGMESLHVHGRDRQYQFQICELDRMELDPDDIIG